MLAERSSGVPLTTEVSIQILGYTPVYQISPPSMDIRKLHIVGPSSLVQSRGGTFVFGNEYGVLVVGKAAM